LHELAILTLVVIAVLALTTFAIRLIGPLFKVLEYLLLCGSVLVILFVAFFVGAEVLMRYAFNAPIPGHLEGSELLMPVIVFLAISYTQATHGHVGMDLVLDALAPNVRRYAFLATLLVSIFICAVIGWFAFKNARQLWEYDDVTMTPPYFRTWPAAAAIPLGYVMVSLRMYLQFLHTLNPGRFAAYEPPDAELHQYE
jgi:TRAP-type C4-dicarboxylate transport system permease small subunit